MPLIAQLREVQRSSSVPHKTAEMQKVGDTGDISLLSFLAGANFWAISAILGHFWAILGNFGSFLGYFGSF